MENPFASVLEPVAKPNQPVATEHGTIATRPLSEVQSSSPTNTVFIFDFETVPDETRFPRPDIEPIPEREPKPDREDIDLADFVKGSVSEIKKEIERPDGGFSDRQLKQLLDEENAKPKPRKGVKDCIETALNADEGAVAEVQGRNKTALEKWKKAGSVNPLFARIVAFGWAFPSGDCFSMTATNDDEERELLKQFWDVLMKSRIRCGYNIFHFDDLLAVVRSLVLGVDVPRPLDRRKYGNREAIDLMVSLYPSGSPQKCKDVVRALGIEPPAGEMEGSQVFDLYHAGKIEEIAEYVRSDVSVERDLYLMLSDVMKF